MMRILLLGFTVLLFCKNNALAQINSIDIAASALLNDKATGDYAILIYADGILKDSIYSKKAKGIELHLEKSKLYSLVFKKPTYQNKIVIVDTHIPAGLRELVEEPFLLQIELSSQVTKPDLEDHPVAILILNKKEKSLVASESYYKLTH